MTSFRTTAVSPEPLARAFYIEGSSQPRPPATRVIQADGAGSGYETGEHLDLSHWVPNATPARYKADTSTEICLRYAADPMPDVFDVVVNNHIDIDGMLSVFAVMRPQLALDHAATLIGAAEMGDFLAYADRNAFSLYQELAMFLAGPARPADIGDVYGEALGLVAAHLEGTRPASPAVGDGWELIERGCQQLDDGTVAVRATGGRLVSFVYPELDPASFPAALRIPELNQVVDDTVWAWPQCRNRDHGEAVQLVSIPSEGRWYHELWAPGYCWAETPHRGPLPGLVSTGTSNRWRVDHPPLQAAVAALNEIEQLGTSWVAASGLTPFTAVEGRSFPVIVSTTDARGQQSPSSLGPDTVAEIAASAWTDAAGGSGTDPTT